MSTISLRNRVEPFQILLTRLIFCIKRLLKGGFPRFKHLFYYRCFEGSESYRISSYCSFVNNRGILSKLLLVREQKEFHDGEQQVEVLVKIKEYQIDDKIGYITGDNYGSIRFADVLLKSLRTKTLLNTEIDISVIFLISACRRFLSRNIRIKSILLCYWEDMKLKKLNRDD